jgi:DNA-binding NarL/FixJ family response regulator
VSAGDDARRGAERTTIIVVTDQALAAARLETMLRQIGSARVVIATTRELGSLAAESAPAIAVLAMSAASIARTLPALRSRAARPLPVIVLTAAPHEAWTSRARRDGVRAVLRSDATADELAAAIAATRAGLLALHPDAIGVASATATPAASTAPTTLTAREHDVLEMMAEGMSNRAIALRLKISRHTVKFHVASVLTKLGARSRTEAVTAGVRQGLISL